MATTKPAAKTSGRNVTGELAYLTRALKAPSLGQAVERMAERPNGRGVASGFQ